MTKVFISERKGHAGFRARVWLKPAADAFFGSFLMCRHPQLLADFGRFLEATPATLLFEDETMWRRGQRSVRVSICAKLCDDVVLSSQLGMPFRLNAPRYGAENELIGVGLTCDRYTVDDHVYPADILIGIDPDGSRLPTMPDRRELVFRPDDDRHAKIGFIDRWN